MPPWSSLGCVVVLSPGNDKIVHGPVSPGAIFAAILKHKNIIEEAPHLSNITITTITTDTMVSRGVKKSKRPLVTSAITYGKVKPPTRKVTRRVKKKSNGFWNASLAFQPSGSRSQWDFLKKPKSSSVAKAASDDESTVRGPSSNGSEDVRIYHSIWFRPY